jgi:hypothetical protein
MKKIIILIGFLICASSYSLEYINDNKEFSDSFTDQAIVFTGHALGYAVTQAETIREEGSFEKYKKHFLSFRFDNDNTTWNFFGHTYTGSQVYLYYRARGYNQNKAFYLSFLSSLWFEVLIENYTENPSFQDTFNTPFFGSILGHYMEKASVSLINSDNGFYKFLGRVINPFSYLVDNEKMAFIPTFKSKDDFKLTWTYFYD